MPDSINAITAIKSVPHVFIYFLIFLILTNLENSQRILVSSQPPRFLPDQPADTFVNLKDFIPTFAAGEPVEVGPVIFTADFFPVSNEFLCTLALAF